MPISIYPPILQSTQTAFLASTNPYRIYFTLQSVTSYNDIGHVQIRIVRQSNNKSIVDINQYPDGVIYQPPPTAEGNRYYVDINSGVLAEKWQAGYLYKIQMRFGLNPMYSSLEDFATWKQQQIDQGAFSEWSTVMVIKAIDKPTVYIKNAEAITEDVVELEKIESTLTPLFSGGYEISTTSAEAEDTFKFDLYSGRDTTALLESSDWQQHNEVVNTLDEWRFKTVLTNNQYYTVVYTIRTINGYEQSSTLYTFLATQSYLGELEGITIEVVDNEEFERENGCISIYVTGQQELTGNYVITRSSEDTDYTVWEDLVYLPLAQQELNRALLYRDFTIESGVRYRYAFQQENAAGLRTSPIYGAGTQGYSVDFQYSYIYRDGVQLRLSLDQTVSSFKHTTLRSKLDTLGDKLPHLVENGNAYYAEFPLSGLISIHMDEYETFFTLQDDGLYYRDELAVPADKLNIGEISRDTFTETELYIDTNLSNNNIYLERTFREKAEEFLNSFNYLLYRSPTEGNIIIGLINVSLTPNTTVNRMIYSFSATAYEVLENTLENLNEYGIINIGEYSSIASLTELETSFGQIRGLINAGTDVYSLIKQAEERELGEGYGLVLDSITEISVEHYPQLTFTAELLELYAQRNIAAAAGEDTTEIDNQIATYEALAEALASPPSTLTIVVNGANVLVSQNMVYHLEEPITSLAMGSTAPVIINYVCGLRIQENSTEGAITSISTSRIWNQVAGVFTGTDSVLETYDYNYAASSTYRIYNPNPDNTVIYDAQGNVLVDNTTYNVFKTVNIYEVIKQDAQKQVELIYDTKFTEQEGDYLTDGSLYYRFDDIIAFDLEADEGTILYIGKATDGSDATIVRIGPTGRYTLDPSENLIRYIALKSPQFCVVNYKCLTNQMTMG